MATEHDASLVGKRLHTLRSARGLSAAQLADLVPSSAVSKTVITNVESGRKRDLTVTELVLLAQALQVSPMLLIVNDLAPWELVGVPGIETTNIEYARASEIYEHTDPSVGGMRHSMTGEVLEGVVLAENNLDEAKLVDKLTHGALDPASDSSLSDSFLVATSRNGSRLSLHRRRAQDPRHRRALLTEATAAYLRAKYAATSSAAPMTDREFEISGVGARLAAIEQELERERALDPSLRFDAAQIAKWEREPVTWILSPYSRNDWSPTNGTPADAAE